MTEPLLVAEGLSKRFTSGGGLLGGPRITVTAVDDVSFSIGRGETLGLVGESGCGKSTTGRLLLRLIEPSAGRVRFDGQEVTAMAPEALRPLRRRMQIVFQDPYGSLNPRKTVRAILDEPLRLNTDLDRAGRERRILELLDQVGLARRYADRYPHEFSGGQRQRIGIARAISLKPDLLVCDEPVSALDVSVQAQILNLLQALQRELGLSYLFISHDLSVVRLVADRVAVMYLGRIVETAATAELFAAPRHPYTRALLSAVPAVDEAQRRQRIVLQGDLPDPAHLPPGCRFHGRCPVAVAPCATQSPALLPAGGQHRAACHRENPP